MSRYDRGDGAAAQIKAAEGIQTLLRGPRVVCLETPITSDPWIQGWYAS